MPRVVAGTNIYISALNFSGTADEVLALGRAGLIEVYVSPAILDEVTGRACPRATLEIPGPTRRLDRRTMTIYGAGAIGGITAAVGYRLLAASAALAPAAQ